MDRNQRKAIGLRLFVARNELKLTQADVAKRMEIHQSHYLRIEKGLVGVSTVQLFKLCEILDIDLKEMIEVYFDISVRDEIDVANKELINKLKHIIRITEDEIIRRDKIIMKLRNQICSLTNKRPNILS